MKTIGIIGGMSWESTVTYYQVINETIREELGGLHSADILLYSIDFAPLAEMQERDDWDGAAQLMVDAARRLEAGGADFLLIGANTMHKAAPQVEKAVKIPLLHIAEATAEELKKDHIRKVGLLGTRYTLLQDFYTGKLKENGLQVILPEEVEEVNRIIYEELCVGVLNDSSKEKLLQYCRELKEKGAEAVILGCTELGLLLKQGDSELPFYDTTLIHARQAALRSLN
ncbi:MAG: aspartate/glutamate racemase family protein [Erysipelotrichaceae bacterium]|nr:aspartate/glutamate racemase family protein [Erysipelotrichaceae bacterium]